MAIDENLKFSASSPERDVWMEAMKAALTGVAASDKSPHHAARNAVDAADHALTAYRARAKP